MFKFCIKLAIFISLIFAVAHFLDEWKTRQYIFTPTDLHTIAKASIAKNMTIEKTVTDIKNALAAKYPGHIDETERWIWNNAGGAMGSMYILHSSITEYVIIFGTAVGTEGHTGRFFRTDDYFMILDGEQWFHNLGDLQRKVYKRGEINHMPAGVCAQYRVPDHVWALEYARGWVPLMLPFGVADSIFSTFDIWTLVELFSTFARHVTKELFIMGKF